MHGAFFSSLQHAQQQDASLGNSLRAAMIQTNPACCCLPFDNKLHLLYKRSWLKLVMCRGAGTGIVRERSRARWLEVDLGGFMGLVHAGMISGCAL